MPLLLKNVNLYVPEPLSPGGVLVEGSKVVAVYKMGETTPDVEVMDLGGAWQMASLNPARQLGIDDHVGRIAPGYDADLTAMNGGGQVVYQA